MHVATASASVPGMVRVLAITALVTFLPGCRIFLRERYRRLDACAEALPIFREGEKPPRPYRVVQIVAGANDRHIALRACAARADAVINVARGRLLRGEAVQYRDAP
jgi:hypothetical protein